MEGEDGKGRQERPTYPKNLTDERVQVDVMRLFSLTMCIDGVRDVAPLPTGARARPGDVRELIG
jgi:hypothetical protein